MALGKKEAPPVKVVVDDTGVQNAIAMLRELTITLDMSARKADEAAARLQSANADLNKTLDRMRAEKKSGFRR